MQFKNSLSIFAGNLALSYKLLLLIFIAFIIAAALFVSLFNPLLDGLREALEIEGISLSFTDIIQDPVKNLSAIWNATTDYLSNNTLLLVSRFIFLGLLVIFARFFGTLALVPATKMLHNKMTTGYSSGLLSSFVANFPQTLLYALISSIIFSIIDLGALFLSMLMFFALYKIFKVSALFIVFGLFLAVYSARITLFSQWLPLIADGGKNVIKTFIQSVKLGLKSFGVNYPMVLTINLVYFAIVMVCTLPTFGVLSIVTLPMYMTMLCICGLTSYFNMMNRKYYTDEGLTVYSPGKNKLDN
ncbi:MAG: hypothetical protein PHC84_03695 [Clostridia bacterium]|nr:hypothetical protein [Clostridia bacterium]